jgi:hypothetical protein
MFIFFSEEFTKLFATFKNISVVIELKTAEIFSLEKPI